MARSKLEKHRAVLDVAATLLMIAASVVLIWTSVRGSSSSRRQVAERPLLNEPVSIAGAALMGDRSAPFVWIVYSDFQCPFCRQFATETLPLLTKKYVNTGRVLLAFWHFPIEQTHPLALKAAQISVCASRQDRFWETHDFLFTDLETAVTAENASVTSGMNPEAFSSCLGDSQVTATIRADVSTARALGVRSTPTFLLGSRLPDGRFKALRWLSGARDVKTFAEAFDELSRSAASK